MVFPLVNDKSVAVAGLPVLGGHGPRLICHCHLQSIKNDKISILWVPCCCRGRGWLPPSWLDHEKILLK